MVSSRREVIGSKTWKTYKNPENKLRHMFEGSWVCFSPKNLLESMNEFEEAST